MKVLTEEMYGQCAWCALVEDGPYAGRLVFQGENRTEAPILFEEYSHGICAVCDARVRGVRRFRKTRAAEAVETSGKILQFR